ncbi:hypothetical protein BQ9231_00046 [Cedratvirus lausannensis]|uniref:Glycosyltransferase n=1 Tax=Cedratvirus lausannensis TaxID=2023205 RepID=A0A285PWE3_9VIRU|nr:hypothetical protein BQ9231_00046 [Cedratvirus lausannensis]
MLSAKQKSRINLFQEYYVPKDEARAQEVDFCFSHNSTLEEISSYYILVHSDEERQKISSLLTEDVFNKVILVQIKDKRPTFGQLFAIIADYSDDEDVNIFSNSDIVFDGTLSHLSKLKKEEFICLTRWNVTGAYKAPFPSSVLQVKSFASHDTWICKGRPLQNLFSVNFTPGVLGCDISLAHHAEKAGYKTFNPCLLLKSYHIHRSNVRYYGRDRVPGPYSSVLACFWSDKPCNKPSVQTFLFVKGCWDNLFYYDYIFGK